MIKVYCDGGARGNPGSAAAAFVVYKNEKLIHKFSRFVGIATNNSAEYEALIMALDYVLEMKLLCPVKIILDSELVASQMKGKYKVKNENLQILFLKAKDLEKKIDANITYEWVSRDENKIADALVNEELDKHKK